MREFLGSTDLTKTRLFVSIKSTDVIMVGKDKDLMFASFKVVLPGFEGFNNSWKLNVIDFVSSFSLKNIYTTSVGA